MSAHPLDAEHEHVADIAIYRGPYGVYGVPDFIAESVVTGKDAQAMMIVVATLMKAAAEGTRAFAGEISVQKVERA
jgi:hypothetical protein